MTSGRSELVEIECVIVCDDPSKKAIAVQNPDGSDNWIWVPRSHCEVTDCGIELPYWLAVEKRLV